MMDADTDDDYEPDFDIDIWVQALAEELEEKLEEILGPDPVVRLELSRPQIMVTMRRMYNLHGEEGVRVCEEHLRESIDIAKRNALMSNGGEDDDLFD